MECCGTGLRGYSEASEQDSNIVYSFHLIPIYNRAQFVDKTDPCCSTSRRQGRCGQVTLWNATGYNVRDPFSCPCWRCTCLPVLTLGMQGFYAARQVLGRSVNLLPWLVRSRAGLRAIQHRADKGHCPCPQWSCAAFRWASEGRCRPYLPVTRECATDAAGGLFLCHYAVTMPILPLKRRTDSAPAPPGASGAFLGLLGLEREYGFRWAL